MPLLVFYDGSCGFCTGAAAWLRARDRAGALRLVSLDAPEAEPYRSHAFEGAPAGRPDSLVVVARCGGEEEVRVRGPAVATALRALGLPWTLAGRALDALPRALADAAYRAVARRRR